MSDSVTSLHHPERVHRALVALAGLSVGDAFGERFFVAPALAEQWIVERTVPAAPWPFTDDTEMALSVVEILRAHGRIDQDALARAFVTRYDPSRGYGPSMHRLIRQLAGGEPWSSAAHSSFAGQGSYGNGAAMRAAPVGAYFADDVQRVVEEAVRSAEVTHAHPEGVAGAVAVAVAAALAWQARKHHAAPPAQPAFLDQVLGHLPASEVHSRLRRARDLSDRAPVQTAVAVLGNGTGLSAQDTVPYALWCAASHLGGYEDALWLTVSGLGDRDTTCAIAGGIVACFVGETGIPASWLQAREPLPALQT
jgi:ADP-ribosylglycohydrolase